MPASSVRRRASQGSGARLHLLQRCALRFSLPQAHVEAMLIERRAAAPKLRSISVAAPPDHQQHRAGARPVGAPEMKGADSRCSTAGGTPVVGSSSTRARCSLASAANSGATSGSASSSGNCAIQALQAGDGPAHLRPLRIDRTIGYAVHTGCQRRTAGPRPVGCVGQFATIPEDQIERPVCVALSGRPRRRGAGIRIAEQEVAHQVSARPAPGVAQRLTHIGDRGQPSGS